MHAKEYPPLLTNTWIFIDFAAAVKPETILSLKILNRHLVLWKTLTGTITLSDAYCPHMGAHLGGGTVKGEILECAFHKKRFNAEGECLAKGRSIHTYPIQVMGNKVYAWFGHKQPWQFPDLLTGFSPHDTDSEWKIFKKKRMNFKFHPKDLLDNTVDPMHFKTYHNQCDSYKPIKIIEITNERFLSISTFIGHPQLTRIGIPFHLELVTESFGPTTLVVNATAQLLQKSYCFKFIFLCTPIETGNTDFTLCIAVKTKPKMNYNITERIFRYFYTHIAFMIQLREFKRESKMIWELKSFLPDADAYQHDAIMSQYNNWYKKFYVNPHEILINTKDLKRDKVLISS